MLDVSALAEGRVGAVLRGKYLLERLIGVGGTAAVYAARHVGVGSRVAVKVLHPHMSLNADIRARFLREGVVANQVEHPGAVRVLDNDTADDGSAFLVMELLEGENLDDLSRSHGGRLPARIVTELGRQLLDVLVAAHDKGIVHRDVKPENLFLTRDGVLKVLDFGIARLDGAPGLAAATRTGRTMGTPAFMAPEQALGKQRDIDAKTDLWAVGATMFTLLAGQFVHEGDGPEALLVYSGSRPARPLASVAPDTPAPLTAVVDRALAFDRDARWGSAGEMAAALDAACEATFGEPAGASNALAPLKAYLGKTAPGNEAPRVGAGKSIADPRPSPGSARGEPSRSRPSISTTSGTARSGLQRTPGPARRWAWLATGTAGGVLFATLVALYAKAPPGASAASSASVAAPPNESREGTGAPRGSTFDCHLLSPIAGVGSMAWTHGALYLLAANSATEALDLVRLPLEGTTAASDAGPRVLHSFPIYQCVSVGGQRTCGFFDTSGASPMLRDGDRLVVAISFDASSCNTTRHTECDWGRSTCGSVWSLDLADLQLKALSKEESYMSGLASDGTRIFWLRSYGDPCSLSAVRTYQSGTGAQTIHPERPEDKDALGVGGGVVVIDGRLSWLSGGVRRVTDGGITLAAHNQGVLYEAQASANDIAEMEPHVVASGLDRPGHLVSDGSVAYFSAMDGRVYKLEGEVLTTVTNLGVTDVLPLLAVARTNRARFLVAATRQKLSALSPGGEVLASAESPGSIRALAADGEGQSSALVAYAASENGVFACEAR